MTRTPAHNRHDGAPTARCCAVCGACRPGAGGSARGEGGAPHHTPGMGHGSAEMYLRRFFIVTALLVPLAFLNEAVAGFFGFPPVPYGEFIGFGIATAIFGFAFLFFKHARHEIAAGKPGMMTLVSIAVASGYAFSAVGTFVPAIEAQFYLEVSTLIWVLLFGHYLEAKSGSAAGNALRTIEKLLPQTAHKREDGEEKDVPVSELRDGDIVIVKPGEKAPADGVVEEGSANVDESLISGESRPVFKEKGDEIVAGSVCIDGSIIVRLSRTGERSTVGQIRALVAGAARTKPRSQKLADRASGVLVYIAVAVSLATLAVWLFVVGETAVFAATLAITVLVIACPHALGLAIPTVTAIATSLSVKNGVFIKDMSKIETLKSADIVIFDKTGTLTEGNFGVADIVAFGGASEEEILRAAASLEKNASHIIAQAIVRHAKEKGLRLSDPEHFRNKAGKGVSGRVDGGDYVVGNAAMMEDAGVDCAAADETARKVSDAGQTPVYVARSGELSGIIALADRIRPEAKRAVERLHALGVKVAMLTGDHERVARGAARTLGIDTYFAEVLPEDKYRHVKSLQEKGGVVVMVGDGINDAPALTQADVGVAIGAGTDVAVDAGDVVLTRNNPEDVARLIVLARRVYGKMSQNLVWALGYNVLAIPAAAGAFAPWGFFLRPEAGALLMSVSTVIVVWNAMRLKKINLDAQ